MLTEFRNPEREQQLFTRRLAFLGGLVVFVFSALLARFAYLQIYQHKLYSTLAESNRISLVPVLPNRGIITDRNGVALAHNYSAYTLEITPARVADLDATIDALGQVVDVQPRDRKRFKKLLEETKSVESLPLRTRLTDEEVARFAANRFRFPGVEIKARLFRQYPFATLASHVIGYIGRINDKDLEQIDSRGETTNYKGTDYIGKVGLELTYEPQLHGTTGVAEVEVDAGGHPVRTISRTPPLSGNNLRLSLDIKLQQVAEEAFADHRGALVAIEPDSGEILALVSKPGFDPNAFVEGIDPQTWDALNTSLDKPLLNRPLRGAYPPGSTIKPFLALTALELGKRTPQQITFDPGFFELPGSSYRFRDDKPGGHGAVDMYKSIVVSCDTYYYRLGSEMDIDDIHHMLSQFGFGQKTGIDIEGELAGILPSRAWKRQRFGAAQYREDNRKWYLGDSVSAGIGQGYNAFTPIQLAHAISTIASGGVSYTPHLVQRIENLRTGAILPIVPKIDHTVSAKAENLDFIRQALVGVNKEGTSAAAFKGAQYVSGGKTGTAQVFSLHGEKYSTGHVDERLRDHAWFMAYAPADHPKIALAVLVENGGFGAQAAAPIARKVFDSYLLAKSPPPGPLPPPVGAAPLAPSDDQSD